MTRTSNVAQAQQPQWDAGVAQRRCAITAIVLGVFLMIGAIIATG